MRRAAERGGRCRTARCAAGSGNRGGMGRTRKLYKDLPDVYCIHTAENPVFIASAHLHALHLTTKKHWEIEFSSVQLG